MNRIVPINLLLILNFLAHIYLSGTDQQLLIGNFIGDFVKGKKYLDYPGTVALGIRLHRSIDSFTDAHPVTSISKKRLYGRYGKYAGVVVDMFYDHLLAVHWPTFHPQPLAAFAEESYKSLWKSHELMPERALRTLRYMTAQNWLKGYGEIEGLRLALTGINARTNHKAGIAQAHLSLLEAYPFFEEEFLAFFPELEAHVSSWLSAYRS